MQHRAGSGVGYKRGYSSAKLFVTPKKERPFVPFSDLRLHVFDSGRIASNVGVGFRSLSRNETWAYGGNLYYDFRAAHNLHTHQVGAGLEMLSTYLDLRINGYLPVGGVKHSDPLAFDRFVGNHLETKKRTKIAYPSVNAEVGVPFPATRLFSFYAAAGPYYLFQTHVSNQTYQDALGGMVRLSAKFFQMLGLEIATTFDRVYHWRVQGAISLKFPLQSKHPVGRQAAFLMRVKAPPVRNEIIPIKSKTKKDLLRNRDGSLLNILFVNNLTSCPGSGTFENPFCSTLLAESNSTSSNHMIYVFAGNGTTTNYDTGFILDQGQRIQGSGARFTLNGISVPPLTPGQNPSLTNGASFGITLASGSTVSGLTVSSPVTHAIAGFGVNNVLIEKNLILRPNNHGVFLSSIGGSIAIQNNTFTGVGARSIRIDAMPNPVNLSIKRNQMINYAISGFSATSTHALARVNVLHNRFFRDTTPFGQSDIDVISFAGNIRIKQNSMDSNVSVHLPLLGGRIEVNNNTMISRATGFSVSGISYSTFAGIITHTLDLLNNTIIIANPLPGSIPITVANTASLPLGVSIQGNRVIGPAPNLLPITLQGAGGEACITLSGNIAQTGYLLSPGATEIINVQSTDGLESGAQQSNLQLNSITISGAGTVNFIFPGECTGP